MFTGDTVPASRSSGAAVPTPIAGTSRGSPGPVPAHSRAASAAEASASNSTSPSVPCGLRTRCAATISPFSSTTAAASFVPPMSNANASRCAVMRVSSLDVVIECRQRDASVQRIAQVGQQVLDVLDADREPDQVVTNLQLGPGDAGMRHQARVFDQRFHPTQGLTEGEQPGPLADLDRLFAAPGHGERDHPAEAEHLAGRDPMAGVTRQARVVHVPDPWMAD